MQLLYISTFMFHKEDETVCGLPSCATPFFQKYLGVFDSVRVLGEEVKQYLSTSALVLIEDARMQVEILPPNTHPKDFKNDRAVKRLLTEEIKKADAILIKPATRRGMMAIRIAEKLHKPYMIEMTGDIHNALRQHPSRLKRAYAPFLYWQIKRTIKNCPFGLYVSRDYLQEQYPINGEMCGCSDVVLEKAASAVMEKRIAKIDSMDADKRVDLCLIGFYQGTMKGVDTAIRALALLPEQYHFTVLGNGTQENRDKWIEYGRTLGIVDRIHFDEPLPNAAAVLRWLDTFDVFVFPTRSEGFGRCVAEAMSRGVPCFATDICTMPELLPQECLFPLDDHERLAALVENCVTNKDYMKKLAEINFEQAKNYDSDLLRDRRNQFLSEFKTYCESFSKE